MVTIITNYINKLSKEIESMETEMYKLNNTVNALSEMRMKEKLIEDTIEGGGWKCHIKYRGQDCVASFHIIQQIYRYQLTVVAWYACHTAITVTWHLYTWCILRKEINQSCPLYFKWHFQPPPLVKKNICNLRFENKSIAEKINLRILVQKSHLMKVVQKQTKGKKKVGMNVMNVILGVAGK